MIASLPAKLIEQGRYEDAVKIENVFDMAIREFQEHISLLCLYKSVPENLEDRFSEYHDLIIKRSATATAADIGKAVNDWTDNYNQTHNKMTRNTFFL